MTRIAFEDIDKATAKAAAEGAAFMCEDNRVIVHSFLNGWVGADWDLAAVLDLIERAEQVCWQDGIAHHDLCVLVDDAGRQLQYNFDVKRPATSTVGGEA